VLRADGAIRDRVLDATYRLRHDGWRVRQVHRGSDDAASGQGRVRIELEFTFTGDDDDTLQIKRHGTALAFADADALSRMPACPPLNGPSSLNEVFNCAHSRRLVGT
jgi:hypothetical protein